MCFISSFKEQIPADGFNDSTYYRFGMLSVILFAQAANNKNIVFSGERKNQTFQPDCDLKLCRAWKINRAIFANKYKKLASNAYFSIQEIAQCFGKHYLQTNCEEFKFKILLMSCVSFFVTPITNYSRFQRKLPISTPTLTTECIWLLYAYRSFQLERNVEVPFSFGRLPNLLRLLFRRCKHNTKMRIKLVQFSELSRKILPLALFTS